MTRQELFHGDLHLTSVSRAEQGYGGARIQGFPPSHFPYFLFTTII